MQIFIWVIVFSVLIITSCNTRGNVPHYILTDSPESKEEVYKHNGVKDEAPFNDLKKDF